MTARSLKVVKNFSLSSVKSNLEANFMISQLGTKSSLGTTNLLSFTFLLIFFLSLGYTPVDTLRCLTSSAPRSDYFKTFYMGSILFLN